MGQLSPAYERAMRLRARQEGKENKRLRQKKKRKLELRGKKVINGRIYAEKAICETKHHALKVEKEIREETGGLPTAVSLTSKGWTVFGLAEG